MLTWYRLWPLFLLPLVVFLPAMLPSVTLFDTTLGGADYRTGLINHTLFYLLPENHWQVFSQWYATSTISSDFLVVALITVNVLVLCMPVIFIVGQSAISISRFFSVGSLTTLRDSAKRG